MKKLKTTVPGRICLFGEHQDYLGLPVITAAINLNVSISGFADGSNFINIDLPDINSSERINLIKNGIDVPYIHERDYFRSVINILKRKGQVLKHGCKCVVNGTIPINSGTSSSSALTVAWIAFLTEMINGSSENFSDPEKIAQLAYQAEVVEFGEPGGMMDHYATAIGGTLYIAFGETTKIQPLKTNLGTFVLGDSLQPKDTKFVLNHVKKNVLSAVDKIKKEHSGFNLFNTNSTMLKDYKSLITQDENDVLYGALLNRESTQMAKKLLEGEFDHREFGELLTEHHLVLDKQLSISTTKINAMIENSIKAGAYGGKINGSGGGGCMFVYAPENPEKVAKAIEESGGKAYIVNINEGLKVIAE